MNQFVLAFPLNVDCPAKNSATEFAITENVKITADTNKVIVPGCIIEFSVVWNGSTEGLAQLFNEHEPISAEETAALNAHKSLLFLLGSLKSGEDLRMVNNAIMKMLSAGALGVYMQQSGTAWTAARFREILGDAEFPMDPWLNYLENGETLFSLGMETFGLPDICISKSAATSGDDPQDILSVVADSLFMDGITAKSGTEVDGGDVGVWTLRQELKSPFAKDAPEFNRQGILRLAKK